MNLSLRQFLSDHPVEASAPCRVDSGGTWDIKGMALPLAGVSPTTVNMALNLRTVVSLSPNEDGCISLSSHGFKEHEVAQGEQVPFDSPFGIFYAAVCYFGFHGVRIHIHSASPVKSALGGSSTALVALVKALAGISLLMGGKRIAKDDLLHLAYHLEDGLSGGNCGIQDQAAAVYGGVHQWRWRYGDRKALVEKEALLDREGQKRLSRRLLVAYSGKSHVSSTTNRKWIRDFLSGRTRAGWVEANKIVHCFARAVKAQDWQQAADLLRKETALRKEITPEALIPETDQLIRQAEEAGCGARFAGAGAGGSLWAIGEKARIDKLREIWKKTLSEMPEGVVLSCGIDPTGARMHNLAAPVRGVGRV